MAEMITDGTGGGFSAKVSKENNLHIFGATQTEDQSATEDGESYNLNTGFVTITATTAMVYLKNNEDEDIKVDAVAAGVKTGTFTDTGFFAIVRNPTAGTMITAANNVDMNQNRNFGSSQTLSNSLALKGASGETFTDGDDVAFLLQGSGRLFAGINFVIPKGNSIGVRYEPDLASGSVDVYVALVVHLANQDE